MPEPEPVGLYVKVVPEFSASNASPRAPITFSIDVEPSVDTVFASPDEQDVSNAEEAQTIVPSTAARTRVNVFFIITSPSDCF